MADAPPLIVDGAEDTGRLDFCETEHNERLSSMRYEAMLSFAITNCELLRSTSAKYPLRFFGEALRENAMWRPPPNVSAEGDDCDRSDDFHPWSRPVTWIHEFWSHSWSAVQRQKVVVLLLEYNGVPASAVGTVAAFVGSGLFAAGGLPGWAKLSLLGFETCECGNWGVLMGVLFFVPTLVCWRSGRRVFLDKISISQVNEKKKLDGVLGIGAFLKASHCLLVLLDSTYLTRLWCVFELAAFSKLMESHPKKVVRFVPLPLGSLFIVFFAYTSAIMVFENNVRPSSTLVSSSFLVFWLVVISLLFHIMRRHQDVLAKLQYQLRDFTFQASNCYCCTVGHTHPDTGARLMCDREAVKVCIEGWFGNWRSFDAFVQGSLLDKFERGIGRTGIPFRLILIGCLPVLWGHMDRVAARLRQKAWDAALVDSLNMVSDFTGYRPLMIAFASLLAHAARRSLSSPCVDVAVSSAMGLAWLVFGAVLNIVWLLNVQHGTTATLAVQVIASGVLTSWVYRDRGCCRHFEACTSGPPFQVTQISQNRPSIPFQLSGGVPADVPAQGNSCSSSCSSGGVPADAGRQADVRVVRGAIELVRVVGGAGNSCSYSCSAGGVPADVGPPVGGAIEPLDDAVDSDSIYSV
eukprot:TRINITY_DN16206_c0_g1_i1.p1 TRINITY_DN16206_c0_g1~~TRINITY_DN16206_c0_g1_i1.p1  ORF type:complete len:643 (-),score=58.59 TRINITY_DN16206_c0_g1_i1:42-1943(-)